MNILVFSKKENTRKKERKRERKKKEMKGFEERRLFYTPVLCGVM